jgi:hypothetical protein
MGSGNSQKHRILAPSDLFKLHSLWPSRLRQVVLATPTQE